MRPSPALVRLALCISSLAPLASAWPSWLPDVDSLVVRQDGESDTSSAAEETSDATNTGATETGTAAESTATDDGNESTATDDENETTAVDHNTARPESTDTDTESESGTQTGTRTGDRSRETTRTTFDQNAYPGGVQIMTPDTTFVATPLFKIGDYVTLGWNYTSLQATPTAVDILLSCSVASETWTLTANMTFETEVSYVWDTDDQADAAESPLLTEMYTLIIKDSEAEVSDLPEPGYLGSFQGFKFGLYHPIPYTPLADWECTGCNAANGGVDGHALKLAIVMTFVTICSFTWFVTGLGIQ